MPVKKIFVALIFMALPLMTAPLTLRSEAPEAGAGASFALSDLAVPEGIGKVQERFIGDLSKQPGTSSRTIIQIQDVHANVTAQENIAAILERLRVVFGIEKAALEGAWVSTSLPKSHALATSREKQLLAQTLLDADRISGPVYAAIMAPGPITLIGIEDEASYEKNRTLFLTHLEKTKEIDEKLRVYGASLQERQRSAWGPELLALGNAFGKFQETSGLGEFLPLLMKSANTLEVPFPDLAQILLFQDIAALEKSLEKERLEGEIQQVIKKYRDGPWTIEELLRGGKIPQEEIGLYPEIKKLARLYKFRDELSPAALMGQIEILTRRVLEKLFRAPEEKTLWEQTERFYIAKKILLLRATPEDLKSYEREKSALGDELAANGLSGALALSLDFYETVKKRDRIFFEKIVNDPSLAGNIAVVTGGFHTDGLSERFREAGISYITITPELGAAAMNEALYQERMKEPRGTGNGERMTHALPEDRSPVRTPIGGQTLSELRNSIAWIDERFPESYKVLLQTRNVRKAEAAFLGETVAVSTPEKIPQLVREGRILPEPGTGTAVSASALRVSEFMVKPRPEQLEIARGWMAQASERREKAMLVSSVSVLAKMLSQENVSGLLEEVVQNGDIVALVQDVPVTEMPKLLLSTRGIDRFDATDIATLVEKTPRFQRLAKKRPFAIMKEDYQGRNYVVLPEKPISLVLFRIITLNPSLYEAAKDPAFLALLENLTAEMLSQELPKKSV